MRRALVSIDFEGLPYVSSPRYHLSPEQRLWSEARRIATRLAKLVAEELTRLGYNRVIIEDAHGLMVNIDPFELPRGAWLVNGLPRSPPSMVHLPEEVDVAIFLGYHARAGIDSVLAHTYAGRYVHEIRVNGTPASEYLLNALYLGEKGVPIGLVAGTEELLEEVETHTPWAVKLPLKKSVSFTSSYSPPFPELEDALRAAIREMDARLRAGMLKPLRPPEPVTLEIVHTSPLYNEITSLIPGASPVDPYTTRITAKNMEEAMRILELALYAWIGAASMVR